MSIVVINLVLEHFGGTGTRKLILLILADFGNEHGERIFPSIQKIAKKAGISESQARRVVHALIAEGWVEVVGNARGGPPGSTRHYRINLARLAPSPGTDATRTPSTDATRTPSTDATRTPSTDATPTPSMDARDGSHGCASRGSTGATLTVIEPSENRERDATPRTPNAGSSLSIEWKPDPQTEAWARQERPELDFEHVFAKFFTHARAEGWKKADWNAAFKKWVLDERRSAGKGPPGGSSNDRAWAKGAEPDRVIVEALHTLGLDPWSYPETHGQARGRVIEAGGEHLLLPKSGAGAFVHNLTHGTPPSTH